MDHRINHQYSEVTNEEIIATGVFLVCATGNESKIESWEMKYGHRWNRRYYPFMIQRGLEARLKSEMCMQNWMVLYKCYMRTWFPDQAENIGFVNLINQFVGIPLPAEALAVARRSAPRWWAQLVQCPKTLSDYRRGHLDGN